MTTHDDPITSPRLRDLLRMRRFLDDEIRAERARLAIGDAFNLIQAAADVYDVTVGEIVGGEKRRHVVKARQMACWMLRQTGLSYPDIATRLHRDHSTVIHACRAIEADAGRLALARQLLAQEVAA